MGATSGWLGSPLTRQEVRLGKPASAAGNRQAERDGHLRARAIALDALVTRCQSAGIVTR